jgi:3-phosphoshikimate 1-carboxyvinyltransferase
MKITVHPSHLNGSAKAPPSKSLTQRAIAAGLLAHGTTVVRNPSYCSDAVAAISMAEALGATITKNHDSITVEAGLRPASATVTLHCGESGLAMRMFSPIAALSGSQTTFTGGGSLAVRPVNMIADALSQLGVMVETTGGLIPFTLKGELSGGRAVIDGSAGSQLLTGLLMALPLLKRDSEIVVHNLKSKPYINLTLKLLSDFGITVENHDFIRFTIKGNQAYKAHEYLVEGDWSGAAFLLAAGAISGDICVNNLKSDSLQADRAMLDVLKMAGAVLKTDGNSIRISKTDLRAFAFNATDSPDLFPPLAVLAAYSSGTSRIGGVGRLEHKESNRSKTIIEVLNSINIRAHAEKDDLVIKGGEVRGAEVSSYNDHRIAMMAAVAALGSRGEVIINGSEAVSNSFPDFFDTLRGCGAMIS